MRIHSKGKIVNTETGEVTLTNEGTLSLRPYQKEAVKAFNDQVSQGKLSGIISAPTGCHAKGHPILMFDGTTKPVEQIHIGDKIMGDDGKERTVINLHKGTSPMLKINPEKDFEFIVNENHIFHFSKNGEYFDTTIKNAHIKNTKICYNNKILNFNNETTKFSISPYLIGIILAQNTKEQFIKNNILDKLKDSYLEKTKFIPQIYKTSSPDNRAELLAGFLDTKATFKNNILSFEESSEHIRNDIIFIARSLGLLTLISKNSKVCISGNLTRIPSKIYNLTDSNISLENSFKWETIESQTYYGFEIDKNHLYLDGNFVIHHNSGKSIIIAEISRQYATENKNVLICTHRKELIEQNEEIFKKHCPNVKTGVISAMCGRKEFDSQITFSGMMTLIRNLEKLKKIDVFIVDEAHRVNTEKSTTYAKIIKHLKKLNPNLVILGLSATPYRMGHGLLYEGEDRLFDCLYYNIDVKTLIEQGYLCNIVSRGSKIEIDLSKVHTKMGDYDQKELEETANNNSLTEHAVTEICKLAKDRKSWVVFCCGIDHALNVKNCMIKHKIKAEIVTGKTPKDERSKILQDFKNGKITAIINVGVLTEGFDAPSTDSICLLTSTKSPNKYIQMIGRGMRIAPNKTDCLVLDFGHNVEYHGFIDQVRPPTKGNAKRKKNDKKVKKCPECQELLPLNTKKCKRCGHIFTGLGVAINHESHSYEGNLMSAKERLFSKEGWHRVVNVSYSIYQKSIEKPRTLRCAYTLDNRETVMKFLSLDIGASPYAYDKSMDFVTALGGSAMTIEDAYKESKTWIVPLELFIINENGFSQISRMRIPKKSKTMT